MGRTCLWWLPGWCFVGRSAKLCLPGSQYIRNYRCYLPSTKNTRVSNTVEFFPHQFNLPKLTLQDQLEEKLTELVDILHAKKNTNELPPSAGLNKLCRFLTQHRRTAPRVNQGTQKSSRTNKHKQNRAATPPRVQRPTRSTNLYDIGTIIRKRFNNNKYYEGEVTNYDPINRLYQIKYLGGDSEEFTPA